LTGEYRASTVTVGRYVALAGVDRELHPHRGAVVQRAEHVVGVQDLDVGRGFDLAGGDRSGARGAQGHALGAFGVHAHGQLLDVQNDVDDVFTDAFERGEFVHNAIDLDGGDGCALQRREKNATQGVAERHTETALERFGDDASLAASVGPGFDLRLLRTDQLVPVSFDHVVGPLNAARRPRFAQPAKEDCGLKSTRRDDAWADGSRCAGSA
jgi:hypothetical protein